MRKDSESIQERLSNIESLLLLQKKALTFIQASQYADISPSYMYKLTSRGKVPHYKPNGKQIYFDKDELDKWLLTNRVKTQDEIDQEASRYTTVNP